MDKQTYYIARYSATGIYGYELRHEQKVICSAHYHVIPMEQPQKTCIEETGGKLITYPYPEYRDITIVDGLKLYYDVYNEANKKISIIEKAFQSIFFTTITVFLSDEPLFAYYPRPDSHIFISSEDELVALIKKDETFKYNPNSIDEKRYALITNNKFCDLLPLVFHAFILQ